jgi:glycosyltransferase involved in cell wall biosynthesis
MVSTYPPTPCGLATFSQALVGGLTSLGTQVDVVQVLDGHEAAAADAAHHLVTGRPGGIAATAAVLDGYDVVMLQHEYGIFGGLDGADVVDLLRAVTTPVVTVLHTVLAAPSAHQLQVLRDVIAHSAVLVTMTQTARARAIEVYGARAERVHVIPHGAADALVANTAPPGQRPSTRPMVLTWGLLGAGKGIEWAVEAMAQLRDLDPRPLYVVAGRTHPKVAEREGERYRDMLQAKAVEFGVEDDVLFDDRYLDAEQLHQLVRSADVVLLPYDSREQVTSGVLIEAVAAGRPVISSRFPHAVELLGNGAGLLVAQRDPAAIAVALRRVLTDPQLAQRLSRKADALAPELSWLSVAGRYIAAAKPLTRGHVTAAVA